MKILPNKQLTKKLLELEEGFEQLKEELNKARDAIDQLHSEIEYEKDREKYMKTGTTHGTKNTD